jgi:hypothetical protein
MFNWNWFQCMENNMDTSHQGILHFGAVSLEDALVRTRPSRHTRGGRRPEVHRGNRATTFIVKDTSFGCSYGAYRPGRGRNQLLPHHALAVPVGHHAPVIKLGQSSNCVITVPLDDTPCRGV